MVWTEVSWLLAAVAGLVVLVAFVAILLTQLGERDARTFPRPDRRRLPDNADLSDGERREAMNRFEDNRQGTSMQRSTRHSPDR